MNKKLLDTKLRSIAHYTKEINDYKEAIEITTQTLSAIEEDLCAFFPIQPGDVFYNGKTVAKVISMNHSSTSNDDFTLNVTVQYCNSRGEWAGGHHLWIKYSDALKYQKLQINEPAKMETDG